MQTLENNNYLVDKQFILDAHKAACTEWKAKLEAKFPEAFPKETFSIGDTIEVAYQEFRTNPEYYILAQVAPDSINLISLKDGNRWTDIPVDLSSDHRPSRMLNISYANLRKLVGSSYNFRKVLKPNIV